MGGYTALLEACYFGHLEVVIELCNRGANIHYKSDDGLTAFECARAYIEIVEELCTRGTRVFEFSVHAEGVKDLLNKQRFRHNVLVLVGEGVLTNDLLRCVHQWF